MSKRYRRGSRMSMNQFFTPPWIVDLAHHPLRWRGMETVLEFEQRGAPAWPRAIPGRARPGPGRCSAGPISQKACSQCGPAPSAPSDRGPHGCRGPPPAAWPGSSPWRAGRGPPGSAGRGGLARGRGAPWRRPPGAARAGPCRRGPTRRLAPPGRVGLAHQGPDELVLAHGVPAGHTVLLRQSGEVAHRLFLQARCGHPAIAPGLVMRSSESEPAIALTGQSLSPLIEDTDAKAAARKRKASC